MTTSGEDRATGPGLPRRGHGVGALGALFGISALVVAGVVAVSFGTMFASDPFAASASSLDAVSVSALDANLAEAQSLQSEIAAGSQAGGAAGKKAGATVLSEVTSWAAPAPFSSVERVIEEEASALAANGSVTGALLATAASQVSGLKTVVSEESAVFTPLALASLAWSAGFRSGGLMMAVAVALAESGGNPLSVDHDPNGTTDYGLWQINWPTHMGVVGITAPATLFVPLDNAEAAYVISGHGANWQPWSTYDEGKTAATLPVAQQAVAQFLASQGARG